MRDLPRLLLIFALSLPLLLAMGWIYGWIDIYSSVRGWSSAVYALLLAAVAALLPWWLGRPLKVRSTAGLRAVAVLNGAILLYLCWGSFAWALHDWVLGGAGPERTAFWSEPARVWKTAVDVAPRGWFEIATLRPAGLLLWVLWAFEAITVLSLPALLAPLRIAGLSFCETCRTWHEDQKPVRIPADETSLAKDVRRRGLSAVLATSAPSRGAAKWVRVDVRRCPKCGQEMYALGQEVTGKVAGGRGTATAVRPLQPWRPLDDEIAGHLTRIRGLLKAADTERFEEFKQQRAAPED